MDSSAAAAKSLQSCPTLCDPIDSSPLGSPVPGILQARTLEWVAISFSNASKWKVKGEREVAQSCLTPRPQGLQPTRLPRPWDFSGKSIGVGCHCLLRGTPLGSFYFRKGKVRLSKGWLPLLPYPWVRTPEALMKGLLQGCGGKATAPLTPGLTNHKPTKLKQPFWEPPPQGVESSRPAAARVCAFLRPPYASPKLCGKCSPTSWGGGAARGVISPQAALAPSGRGWVKGPRRKRPLRRVRGALEGGV